MATTTRSLLVGVVLIVAVASAGVVVALDDGPAAQPAVQSGTSNQSITVSASGDAQAQPDTALLRIGVEARDPDVTAARDAVAENVSSVTAALTDLGIAEEDISTVDYRIYEDVRRDGPTDERPESEYRVRHILSVEVTDTDMVGEAIDAAVDAGATNVQDVEFALSTETRQQLRNEALSAAMTDARSQADIIAQSAQFDIEGVSSVETGVGYNPNPRLVMEASAGGDGGTDIATGPVTVTAQVTVTYDTTR